MWQANFVKQALLAAHPDVAVEIVGMTTQGDRDKQSSLNKIGGKGVFVKELEHALLNGDADIAVHSMKDVPSEMPEGLGIAAICEREDPRDAFVSNHYQRLDDLPAGARVGSSSLRRRLQLQHHRPELTYLDIRGNVETRLQKLDSGDFDAIILAVAGLKRLGLEARITHPMSTDLSIPAAGQGAVGIQARLEDTETLALLEAINHQQTFDRVSCERLISTGLGASCELPIGAFAEIIESEMKLVSYVGSVPVAGEASVYLRLEDQVARSEAQQMARRMTEQLIARGAAGLIGQG